MAMAVYAMTIGEFVQCVRRHGCKSVVGPAIAWRLGEIKKVNTTPPYLVKGDRMVTVSYSENDPLDTSQVWACKYRFDIAEDPT